MPTPNDKQKKKEKRKDLHLKSLRERLSELSKSTDVVNSNLRDRLPAHAGWMGSVTRPYSIVTSPCRRVRVALLGLLSDEPGVFRDNTFKGLPIGDVVDAYASLHERLVPQLADACVPLTHQSIQRDRELAAAMLSLHGGKGVIIGGHEHEPFDELVAGGSGGDGDDSIRILKAGMDAAATSLIDLSFDVPDLSRGRGARLTSVRASLERVEALEPSPVVQQVVDKHMSVVRALEDEDVIDANGTGMLPPDGVLSSQRTRYQQTSVGGIFLQMIKEELDADAAIVNGATIKGGTTYEDGKMSYAELKKELPFPTKMVVVSMTRGELWDAVRFSRTATEEGVATAGAAEVPRRGYLQVDADHDRAGLRGPPDEVLAVALPRNLLNGFCNITPLKDLGARLKKNDDFPGPDDYVPAIDLIMRYACKDRWSQIVRDADDFDEFDLNDDGVLDRPEIARMLGRFLGHEPADFVVDDMIAALDEDENGVIDKGEIGIVLARMEREGSWRTR